MGRRREFNPDREQLRLENYAMQLSDVIRDTLARISVSPDSPSAALLDTVCRTIRNLNELLADLSAAQKKREAQERSKVESSVAAAALPFTSTERPVLPFPLSTPIGGPE